tara:strand:+ start:125 stop:622 length:498 start_codon:yes stop_codon:yes gene_type:complete
MSQETDIMEDPNWGEEITTLINDSDVKPDGFGLYLNFMLPYNVDSNGVIDEDAPYVDLLDDLSGPESQTRFLVEALALKNSMQVQSATIRDPTTKLVAGYHYGLFYVGDEIVSTFVPLRTDIEIEFTRMIELHKVPVLPMMQFTLLSQNPPEESGEIADGDEDLF